MGLGAPSHLGARPLSPFGSMWLSSDRAGTKESSKYVSEPVRKGLGTVPRPPRRTSGQPGGRPPQAHGAPAANCTPNRKAARPRLEVPVTPNLAV